MNKEQLALVQKALVNVKLAEMQRLVPDPFAEHEFSEGFEDRMKELIKNSKPRVEKTRSLRLNKRTITILIAAAVLISLLLTMSIMGDKINDFFVSITEKGTAFFAPTSDENPKTIETEYYPAYIPDGFEQVQVYSDDGVRYYTLEKNQTKIYYRQLISNSSGHKMNTEGTEYDVIEINGCSVYYILIQNFNAYDFYWNDKGYAFSLTCGEGVAFDEAVKIIESITEK